ncbi:MAG: hypothetical protein HQ574_00935 [Chloroflexi bacterium]|nr:hypothetical protein [Chloroflexota bacterium]
MMDQSSDPSLVSVLGYIAVALLGLVMILQLLLAVGILPTSMAWGGRQTDLTPALQWSSLGAVIILGAFSFVIARRSGILWERAPSLLIKILSWLVTGYMGLNSILNFISPSMGERWFFGPITMILFVLCLMISLSRSVTQSH